MKRKCHTQNDIYIYTRNHNSPLKPSIIYFYKFYFFLFNSFDMVDQQLLCLIWVIFGPSWLCEMYVTLSITVESQLCCHTTVEQQYYADLKFDSQTNLFLIMKILLVWYVTASESILPNGNRSNDSICCTFF